MNNSEFSYYIKNAVILIYCIFLLFPQTNKSIVNTINLFNIIKYLLNFSKLVSISHI